MPYSLKCKKNGESTNGKVVKTKIERIMLLSKCEVYNSENLLKSKKLEDY